jgi:ATP-dependent Clp protease adaptor protein ClpS
MRQVARRYTADMTATSSLSIPAHARTAPVEVERPETGELRKPDRPWIVIVWNDPINLMSYVVYVFQKLFDYPKEKATKLMLEVHHEGRSVVASGSRERCEFWVSALHGYGLWATLSHDS